MQFADADCFRCGRTTTVRLDAGSVHRCGYCGQLLPIRRSQAESVVHPPNDGETSELEAYFEHAAHDSLSRADRMIGEQSATLPTGLRRGPRRMGRWIARWTLHNVDDQSVPPGLEAARYRREELGVHVATASVAIDAMADPNQHSARTRHALFHAIVRRPLFADATDVERTALAYADAVEARDLAAVGFVGGRRATPGSVGHGLLVAGTSLMFVAAWSSLAWDRMAPTFAIA